MKAGSLIRQQQAHDAYPPCTCGHASHQHHELGYGNAGHVPGEFHCDVCECKNYTPATAS